MKKVFSLFLSILMLLSITAGIDFTAQAQVFDGKCGAKGSNVSWSLDTESGVLTISGSGKMKDFSWNAPWGKYESEITSVVVSSGVTTIGDFAFSYCENVKSITLPKTITSIGKYAFEGTTSLTKITIPNGVKSIGNRAFSYCDSLSDITIPKSVTEMGAGIFSECSKLKTAGDTNSKANIKFGWTDKIPANAFFESGLTSISIPKTITSIGDGAFCYCFRLKTISVDKSNKNYSSQDGNLFNKKKTTFIQYSIGKSDKKYTMPKSVTQIAYGAFCNSTKLTSVTLSKNLKSIGTAAFRGTNLNSITIPDKVENIGADSFRWCYKLSSAKLGKNVKTIGESAFGNCSKLKSITIPDNVKTIGDFAFSWCSKLKSIAIPKSVEKIGDTSFAYCASLAKITVDKKNKNYTAANNTLYDKNKTVIIQHAGADKSTKYTSPDTVTRMTSNAFYDSKINSISLSSNLKAIEASTFVWSALKSVNIPDSVEKIGVYAFGYSQNLSSVTIGSGVKSIGRAAFADTNIKEIKIPDSVTKLEGEAFRSCKSLKNVEFGASVTKIAYDTFDNCEKLSEVRLLNPKTKIEKDKTYKDWDWDDETEQSIKITVIDPTIPAGATIYGYKNSTAQDYAKKHNQKFVELIDTSKYKIILSKTEYVYDGKVKRPAVTVKDSKGKTVNSKNYTVTYSDGCKDAGKYSVKINFVGKYGGNRIINYTIKPKATSISDITAKSKGFTVKWKKQSTQTSGYEIQYATNSKFTKDKKTVTINKNKTTSKSISKLKANKKYYVRVRTYKTVNGKKIYSDWSKAKSVTTKK